LDVPTFGALPLLVYDLECKQHLTEAPFLGKQEAINHSLPVDFELPNVASKLIDIRMAAA